MIEYDIKHRTYPYTGVYSPWQVHLGGQHNGFFIEELRKQQVLLEIEMKDAVTDTMSKLLDNMKNV